MLDFLFMMVSSIRLVHDFLETP